jgi:hypothetical protein
MPTLSCCDRLTIRVVLLKVSPLVARLISVPDDLSLEELHDVLQLVLGWSGQAFYNFRIHGQEIGRRRHLRARLLREFQLRRREKFLYTYDFLDLWEWEIRVLDIEPGRAEAWRPRCLAGRATTPPEECGGPRGYMRILDQRKYYPPMAEQELVEKALQPHRGSAAGPGSSRLAQGVARSRAGEGRTTAQRIRTISTGSFQPAGGQ